jgi:hypothetical protein
MVEVFLKVLATMLIAMSIINTYFVWHGMKLYRRVRPRSPVLFAMFGVKFTVWAVGLYIAFIAYRVLADAPPLPFDGVGLGLVVLTLFLLPAFIWYQMRKFTRMDLARDAARDSDRDIGRDEGRDPIRDSARDVARDAEKDAENGRK